MLVITWVKVFWVFFLWMRILIWFFLQVVCLWRRIAVLIVFWVACMRRGIMVVFLISSFFSQWVNIMISSEFLLQPKKYRKVNIELMLIQDWNNTYIVEKCRMNVSIDWLPITCEAWRCRKLFLHLGWSRNWCQLSKKRCLCYKAGKRQPPCFSFWKLKK